MDSPSFVYTTYIKTTPERLWQALTDPAFTSRYWKLTFETDWKPGSQMVWHNHGVTIADPEQVVLESDPYRRLSYTWHTFTPELADALRARRRPQARGARRAPLEGDLRDRAARARGQADRAARRPRPRQRDARVISGGWPLVLSALKTLIETDAVLATA